MNWQTFLESLVVNWKTTVGGFLIALPPLVAAAGFVISVSIQHWLNLCSAVGGLLLGLAAKDASTHSTVAQVEKSTAEAEVAEIKSQT